MAGRYEVELTVVSARDLKNVNWRNGELQPYAVAWIDTGAKCSTRVDVDNGENPSWDEKLTIPFPRESRIESATLYIDVVHANARDGVKPLVGSGRIAIREIVDDAGIGGRSSKSIRLKRPSGRPHGRLEIKVAVKEPSRGGYYDPYAAPPPAAGAYGASRDYGYGAPPPTGYPYGAPPPQPAYGGYGAPPPAYGSSGYGAAAGYGAAPVSSGYGAPPVSSGYGAAPVSSGYGYGAAPAAAAAPVQAADQKKNKFGGMGAGLAIGAVGGLLGGIALTEGAHALENKFDDAVDERVDQRLAEDEEEEYDDDY